ncbi:hypothetical protein J6590_090630 [Homalodisca vitripennis]|nr:hypothetical protein J6590_019427 [Homalodisca vitripennis]KAG8265638.1 hypothetical protein J6590_090630 [Homalodisca vitripennis]
MHTQPRHTNETCMDSVELFTKEALIGLPHSTSVLHVRPKKCKVETPQCVKIVEGLGQTPDKTQVAGRPIIVANLRIPGE